MKRRLGRVGDLVYAALFGLLVAFVVFALGELVAVGAGAEGEARQGWAAFILAIAACAGIAAARGIRWQRQRSAR